MKNVTVYSTPTCGFCTMLKEFLAEKGVEFKEIDVAQDQQAAVVMMEKSGQMGVPQTVISSENGEEEVIVGFDQARLEEVLGLSK